MCLDVYADGRLIGQTLANRYRDDLARAGLGRGLHGFTFSAPVRLTRAETIEVRRSLDGEALALPGRAAYAFNECGVTP